MDFKNDNLDGWLIIDKHEGISSRHVVNIVKKTLNIKKIGHAGTLDPLASGVLALALGKATKTVKYIMDGNKKYNFTIKWGTSTDTEDAEGEIISKSSKIPNEKEINFIIKSFVGSIMQVPPNYSAIKINGKRAYAMARKGEKFIIKPREVFLRNINIIKNKKQSKNLTMFQIECGKGFYVRSLVRDICKKLDVDGHVIKLKRIKSEPFDLKESVSIKKFLKLYEKNDWKNFFLPIYSVLNKIKYVGK